MTVSPVSGGPPPPGSVRHAIIAAVDIVGFSDPRRTNRVQLDLRQAMYERLEEAFGMSGLSWPCFYREDRGDGCFVIAPAATDPDRMLDPLAHNLATVLDRHNSVTGEATRLRLRLALNAGDVHGDDYGVTGRALTHTFRLLDAASFKRAIASSDADLGLIVSDRAYSDAVDRGYFDADAYQPLSVICKETRAKAWLWLSRPAPVRDPDE